MCEDPQWCWYESTSKSPHGPFPSRDAAIEDANTILEKKGKTDPFFVSKCLHVSTRDCIPESGEEAAGYIMGMLDDNCDPHYQNPNECSFELAKDANVQALRDFLAEWVSKYARYSYIIPDPVWIQEVSRTTKR